METIYPIKNSRRTDGQSCSEEVPFFTKSTTAETFAGPPLHFIKTNAAFAYKKEQFLPDVIKPCSSATQVTMGTSYKVLFFMAKSIAKAVILAHSLSPISLHCVCKAVRFCLSTVRSSDTKRVCYLI